MCIVSATVGTVLAVVGAVSALAGGAVSAYSSYQSGKQQEAYYNYQAQVAQDNAKIAENNAALERQQGIEEARLQRIKTLQAVGSQQTAMAANGIDVTQGTALDVIEDTAAMGELDALQTRYNYERKALAYEAEAGNYSNQANLDIIAGQNAYSSGKLNALAAGLNGLSSGLSSANSVASKWYSTSGSSSSGVLTGYTVGL